MSKITSKYQVTLPKAIAEEYRIHPGDEIEWMPAGDVIRVIPSGKAAANLTAEARLRLFDQATGRQRARAPRGPSRSGTRSDRGWTREDLYGRGRSR